MKTIYLNSRGSDNNTGLNEGSPVATGRRAYDLAEPGDTIRVFAGEQYPNFLLGNEYGTFAKSNITVDRYGQEDAPNPLILGIARAASHIHFQHGDGLPIDNVTIRNLNFLAFQPTDPYADVRGGAITAYCIGQNVVLENINIEGYVGGMNLSSYIPGGFRNGLLRNVVVSDTYARLSRNGEGIVERTHSGGFFLSNTAGFILADCAALNVGWQNNSELWYPTKFNQGFYMHGSNSNLLLDRCMAIGASAGGIQLRGQDQSASNCLVIGCPVGIGGGSGTDYNHGCPAWSGKISNCVVWNSDDIVPHDQELSGRRGNPTSDTAGKPAFGMMVNFCDGPTVEDNWIVGGKGYEGAGMGLVVDERANHALIKNNKVFNWRNTLLSVRRMTDGTRLENNWFGASAQQTLSAGAAANVTAVNNKFYGGWGGQGSLWTPYTEYSDGMYYDVEVGADAFLWERDGIDLSERAAWARIAQQRKAGNVLTADQVAEWLAARQIGA